MHRKDIFEEVAKKYHTTPEDVYTEIQKVIDIGYDNPNPAVRARWKQVKIRGERPTPEEVIAYLAGRLASDQ